MNSLRKAVFLASFEVEPDRPEPRPELATGEARRANHEKVITKEEMALLKEASEMFNQTGCVPGIDGEQVPAERIVPDAKEYILEAIDNAESIYDPWADNVDAAIPHVQAINDGKRSGPLLWITLPHMPDGCRSPILVVN